MSRGQDKAARNSAQWAGTGVMSIQLPFNRRRQNQASQMLALEQVWAPAYTGLSTYLSFKSIQENTPEHGRLYSFTC